MDHGLGRLSRKSSYAEIEDRARMNINQTQLHGFTGVALTEGNRPEGNTSFMAGLTVQNYKIWTGNQKLNLCRGKIFIGPEPLKAVMTVGLINTMGLVSIAKIFHVLAVKRADLFWMYLLELVFLFVTNLTWFLSAFTDPGTIPSRKYLFLKYRN